MDEQASIIDEAFDQPSDQPAEVSHSGVEDTSQRDAPFLSDPTPQRKEPSMNQHEFSEEAPAASLVGSLATFSLSDILSMLASTKQTGELQVVSDTTDGKVWLADGEFSNANVGAATTIGQAVFELACIGDGWFYFTDGVMSSSGQPTVPVLAVLNEVRPQVDEWREIRRDVPLEAVVTLAPDPPGQDVQIRNDQWRVLTMVGTSGHSVRAVLDQIGGDQIVGLRTLRDLHTAGLLELDVGPADQPGPDPGPVREPAAGHAAITSLPSPPAFTAPAVDGVPSPLPSPPPSDAALVADDGRQDSLAEVAIMPPPIADDPWTPTPETTSAGDNGVA
jgi:Domain of unknown function (DUF4388)